MSGLDKLVANIRPANISNSFNGQNVVLTTMENNASLLACASTLLYSCCLACCSGVSLAFGRVVLVMSAYLSGE